VTLRACDIPKCPHPECFFFPLYFITLFAFLVALLLLDHKILPVCVLNYQERCPEKTKNFPFGKASHRFYLKNISIYRQKLTFPLKAW
jgi:hypothetical protein